MNYVIGVDIGGSHISSAIIDIKSNRIVGNIHTTYIDHRKNEIDVISKWSENLLQTASTQVWEGTIDISFAIPGPFDYQSVVFLKHPNDKFSHLIHLNLKDVLQNYMGRDLKVHYENDAACFGLGSYYYESFNTPSRLIAITMGTGIGSSFISAGIIQKTGNTIPKGGEVYMLPFQDGIADDYFSSRWFEKIARHSIGKEVNGLKELLDISTNEDISEIFKIFSENFFQFMIPIIDKFQPEIIVLGGNICKAWPLFSHYLIQPFMEYNVDIYLSSLGEQATLLGAGQVFIQNYYE